MGTRRLAPLLFALLLTACGDTAERERQPERDAPPEASPPQPTVVDVPVDDRAEERERMVAYTIESRDVRDPLVLAAMRRVPRHLFLPEDRRDEAYLDSPVPIGWDQTISQPYIVASMTEHAEISPTSKVLEIGTGSGYQAAILAAITRNVFSIEIKEPLVKRARASLDAAGFGAVNTKYGDGYHGWAEHAPFDAIVVTAAAPHIPPPLVKQLAVGGRMVIPVGPTWAVQDLMLVTKDDEGQVRTKSLYPVRFVPLTRADDEE